MSKSSFQSHVIGIKKCCLSCVKNKTSECIVGSKEANNCINKRYSKWVSKYN